MEGLTRYEYQLEIDQIIDNPVDDRAIYWYWDKKGNIGKTTYAKHLCLRKDAIECSGGAKDMQCFIHKKMLEDTWWSPTLVIMDIPRSRSQQYVSMSGIEKIKDGKFLSTKYEPGMCLYDPPHLVCFANEPPDESRLSEDRWHVVEIDTEGKCHRDEHWELKARLRKEQEQRLARYASMRKTQEEFQQMDKRVAPPPLFANSTTGDKMVDDGVGS